MGLVECTSQTEVDAAVAAGKAPIVRSGLVRAYGSATVYASGSATVHASGSATVHAYGSATVHAYGSAPVHAYDSATVYAYDSATVHAYGSATVRATPLVAIHDHGPHTNCGGGVYIAVPSGDSLGDWRQLYGTKATRGWVTVYKAVNDDLKSDHGFAYPPGKEVACTDWAPTEACGNGLHFSPRPFMALRYHGGPTARFLECQVKADEVVMLGDKLKAPRCKVVREVDIDGQPIKEAL